MFSSTRKSLIVAITAALVAASTEQSFADTATANLSVTATVVSSCRVDAATLAFGNYDPTASAAVDATASLQVSCTKGSVATVGLGLGSNALGTVRRMGNGSEHLNYELYQEATRTTVWGTLGGGLLSLSAASNAAQTVVVYGRLPQGQNVSVGSFSDTVVVTVTF